MKYILGIDVGGSKVAAGLVDENLQVSDVKVAVTSQGDLMSQLIGVISSYDKFESIGLGLPGQVLKNGIVTKLPNINDFPTVNIKHFLLEKFKVQVSVLNDSKAFALAEAVAGAGQNYGVVAGVILGTGIGVGLVNNKKIYFGKDGLAGELEHTVLLDGKMLRDHRHDAGQFESAEDARKYLKTLLDMVVLSWNPDIIVLGGAWSKISGTEEMANELTINSGGYENQTPVKISQLDNPGIIGAALSVLN